jgi:hypothetical protein
MQKKKKKKKLKKKKNKNILKIILYKKSIINKLNNFKI